ncbi:Pycsar system effector family protein [Paucihalobacter sp.]|uniref:Pycsar system effector family protein n=1 Tax=Paucihalobacter sp. TaxID=2850405 RepID=UPI003D1620E6
MAAEEQGKEPNHQNPLEEPKIEMIRSAHTEDMVDHYWGSINYIFSLIKASEIKAGLILSFYGIILNFIYQKISDSITSFEDNIVLYVLLFLWFGCTAYSVYCCVRCFMPKIEDKYEKNIFFFRDVITKFGSIKEFSKTFYKISLDEKELFDHMGQQIYIISKIAAAKFKFVNQALRFLGFGLALLLVTVVYYLVSTLV